MPVVWHGLPEFERAFTRIDTSVKTSTKTATFEAGHALADVAKAEAPHRSGALAGSIVPIQRSVGGDSVVQVGPTIIYGRRVELGFKGRKSVRGKRKRLAAGIDTGRRGLNPTPSNPYLARATAESGPAVAAVYRRAWGSAITKF